jgi:hypothetical protein
VITQSTNHTIRIKILDENDNSPVFDLKKTPFAVDITENDDKFSVDIVATDLDEGLNSTLFYEIVNTDGDDVNNTNMYNEIKTHFYLDSSSGKLTMKLPLDYEKRTKYNLRIKCSDRLGLEPLVLSSFFNLTVNVIDVNDNPPKFQLNSIETDKVVQVNEKKEMGSRIKLTEMLSVNDNDVSPEYKITKYRVSSINGVIGGNQQRKIRTPKADSSKLLLDDYKSVEIDQESGDLIVSGNLTQILMDTMFNELHLKIEAYDIDYPLDLFDSTVIIVKIVPSNDRPPVFIPSDGKYEGTLFIRHLDEVNNKIGQIVGIVNAIDQNDNGFVNYEIINY